MKKFMAGMVAFAIILSATLYVLNLENNKLKIENDRLQAQQDAYTQQAIEQQSQRQLDAIADALSEYDSYNTTSDGR